MGCQANRVIQCQCRRTAIISDKKQVGHLSRQEALIGEASVVAKAKSHKQLSAVFLGLNNNQFVYQNLNLVDGHRVTNSHELVVDTAFKQEGYKLGSQFKLNGDNHKYTIVGFIKNAKLNIAPVVYGQMNDWKSLGDYRRTRRVCGCL